MSLVETTAWLVDIPSVTGEEAEIADAVVERLAPRYRADEIVRVGNSVVVGGRSGRPLVLLVGHLDTVPSQGAPPARVEDGRLHGLGATDMKGGLAVMIHLLESEAVAAGRYDVIGVFYEAEEGPSAANGLEPVLGAHPWLTEAELAVVLEPSDREIQLGCNGVINARVEFHGRSSHSARPWWGENAITKAGDWLAQMHRLEPELVVIDGLEFREVMSVTAASGGIANNVVPDRFTLNLNYRFSPRRDVAAASERLRRVCERADAVTIVDAAPAGPIEAGHPLVRRLAELSGAEYAAKQGWTDVARLGAHGVLGINFGPGEAAQAHQAGESVRLSDLEESFEALEALLTD